LDDFHAAGYDLTQRAFLTPAGDADGDGATNQEEWEAYGLPLVPGQPATPPETDVSAGIAAYVAAALNPAVTPSGGEGEGEGEGEPEPCPYLGVLDSQGEALAAQAGAAGIGSPDWSTRDFEGWPGQDPSGDGLPESYQMALITAVICDSDYWASASVLAQLGENATLYSADLDDLGIGGILKDSAAVMAAMMGTSEAMKTTWNGVFMLFGVPEGLPRIAQYKVFTGSGKASNEIFSADGDLDGDGLTNQEEYDQVVAAGGDRDVFVRAAMDPGNFWPGNPALPLAGLLGLALLSGAASVGGVYVIRKKH
jgi:hypothetical protein